MKEHASWGCDESLHTMVFMPENYVLGRIKKSQSVIQASTRLQRTPESGWLLDRFHTGAVEWWVQSFTKLC
jgi:hypothetical protein